MSDRLVWEVPGTVQFEGLGPLCPLHSRAQLETFFITTTGTGELKSTSKGRPGCANHPIMHKTILTTKSLMTKAQSVKAETPVPAAKL